MRKYLYLSAAALVLAGCSSDEFLGEDPSAGTQKNTGEIIAFGSEALNSTRATFDGATAAEKLNNNFIVYGFKTSATEAPDGSVDQMVFDRYNVNYTEGTANTTESNTANWEYVGLNNVAGTAQTIKYWDLSADSYVFSAVSGTGITATKTTSGTTVYDKGWTVELPAGGDLSTLYASDRKVVTSGDYRKEVDLTFRALATKIRFAIYETVPGYSINIDKVFYKDGTTNKIDASNFHITGNFKNANTSATTPLTVTYYDATDASVENRPKVTFDNAQVTQTSYGVFGGNLPSVNAIGETSATATYDDADKAYTFILPYESLKESTPAQNVLKLKVNYTLTSTDGSGEKIKVYGATAYVPTQYTQWKPNFAYTYIFKISDNTNGTTVTPGDPDDPDDPGYTDPDDPEYDPNDPNVGLYPITFDAVVITDEEDVQETITTVAEPSITTYAKGEIVTKNDEYVAGEDIYASAMMGGVLQTNFFSKTRVFEVHNSGTIETKITEEIVANWANNFCTLTPITTTEVTAIPRTDGTNMTFATGTAFKFTPAAGKVYAIQYKYKDAVAAVYTAVVDGTTLTLGNTYYTSAVGGGEFVSDGTEVADAASSMNYWTLTSAATPDYYVYKVVKVAGSETTPVYALTDPQGGNNITALAGTHTLTLTQDSKVVLGAANAFTITPAASGNGLKIAAGAADGEYVVSVDPAAVAAGTANDTYTVDFGGAHVDVTVALSYSLTALSAHVIAGNATGQNTTLTVASTETKGAKIVCSESKLHITDNNDGTYTVKADADLAYGSYSATIAGQTLSIDVDSYSFDDIVITNQIGGGSTGTLTLKVNGAAVTTAVPVGSLTTNPAVLTGVTIVNSAAGAGHEAEYTVTATGTAAQEFFVYYENAKAKVTINSYAFSNANPAITRAQTAVFELKCGSKVETVDHANLVEQSKPTLVCTTMAQYNKYAATPVDAATWATMTTDASRTITATYTLGTNPGGKALNFSGANLPGNYVFRYQINAVDVAEITINVND